MNTMTKYKKTLLLTMNERQIVIHEPKTDVSQPTIFTKIRLIVMNRNINGTKLIIEQIIFL